MNAAVVKDTDAAIEKLIAVAAIVGYEPAAPGEIWKQKLREHLGEMP